MRNFVSEVFKTITCICNCVKWVCRLVVSSHPSLPFVTKVTKTCALSLNTFNHFHLSLTMFLTMSCDKVTLSMLVTSRTLNFFFVMLLPSLSSWTNYECSLLYKTFHVHFHQICLCKLFC